MNAKPLLLLAAWLLSGTAYSQNLIPNPGFESYSKCPTGLGELRNARHWINPSTGGGSPDYYHKCGVPALQVPNNLNGVQAAHGGDAYAGLYLWQKVAGASLAIREYIESPLTSPLVAGKAYVITMYVNLAGLCRYTSNSIGAYFSNDSLSGINNYNPIPVTPQFHNNAGASRFDTTNWTRVSGEFVAKGGERYVTIGNFRQDAQTDTAYLKSQEYDIVYVFVDDVSVICAGCPTAVSNTAPQTGVHIFPNPVADKLRVEVDRPDSYEIRLVDIHSRLISQTSFTTSFSLDATAIPPGIYFYEVSRQGQLIERKKLLKL